MVKPRQSDKKSNKSQSLAFSIQISTPKPPPFSTTHVNEHLLLLFYQQLISLKFLTQTHNFYCCCFGSYNKRRCEIKKHFSTSYKVGGGSAANINTSREQKSKKTLIYLTGLVVAMVGSTYAAVPLYRRFCQATGYGGTVQRREVSLLLIVCNHIFSCCFCSV